MSNGRLPYGISRDVLHKDFGDVLPELDRQDFGALAGDGGRVAFSVKESLHPTGVAFELHCPNCSRLAAVEVSWPEVTQCAFKVPPIDPDQGRQWAFDSGEYVAPLPCQGCGHHFLKLAPAQCETLLHRGRQRNFVTPQLEQQALAPYRQQPRR